MDTDSIKLEIDIKDEDESLFTLGSEIKVEEITITEFQDDVPLSEAEFQTENKEKNIKNNLQQDNQSQEKERTSTTQEEYLSSYSNDTLQEVLKSVTSLLEIVKCIQEKQNEESKKNDEKFNEVLKAINETKDLAFQNQLKISTIIANCKDGSTKTDCVQFQGAYKNCTSEQSTVLEDDQHRKEDDNNYSLDNIQSRGVGDGVTELEDRLHCRKDDVQSLLADDSNHDMEFDIEHPSLAGDDDNESTKLKGVQFHKAKDCNNHSTEFRNAQSYGKDIDTHNTECRDLQSYGADNDNHSSDHHCKDNDNNHSLDNIQSCGVDNDAMELEDGQHSRADDVQSLEADDINHHMEFDVRQSCLAGDDNNESTKLKDVQFQKADNCNNHRTEFRDLHYHGDVDNHCSEFKNVHSDGRDNGNLSLQLKDVHPHGNNSFKLKNVRFCRLRPRGAELKDLRSCKAELKDLRSRKANNNFSDNSKSDISDGETVNSLLLKDLNINLNGKNSEAIGIKMRSVIEKKNGDSKLEIQEPLSILESNSEKLNSFIQAERVIHVYNPDIFLESSNLQEDCENKCSRLEKLYKSCPICAKRIKNLGSHLKTFHKCSYKERRKMIHMTRKRKLTTAKNLRTCPLPQCSSSAPYVRVDKHLRDFHKLDYKHPMFRRFINTYAKPTEQIKVKKTLLLKIENAKNNDKLTEIRRESNEPSLTLDVREMDAESVVMLFFEYLQEWKGGNMKKINAKQYGNKIRQILVGVGVENVKEFESLDIEKRLENYFKKYIEDHEGSSAKFYVFVLVKFLKYLGTVNKDFKMQYDSLIDICHNFLKSFKTTKISMKEKIEDIPPFEITTFNCSEMAKECSEIFKNIRNGVVVSLNEILHAKLRNFLIFSGIVRSGCRSCVIASMTLKEFENSSHFIDGAEGFYVINVQDHKNKRKHSTAKITLDETVYNYFECYIKKIRSRIVAVDSEVETVFITWSGTSMNSDDINKGITSIWNAAGLNSKISPTVLRKILTTKMHSSGNSELKDSLARQLAHRTSTTEKHYKDATADLQSVSTCQTIFNTLTGNYNDINTHYVDSLVGNMNNNTHDDSLSVENTLTKGSPAGNMNNNTHCNDSLSIDNTANDVNKFLASKNSQIEVTSCDSCDKSTSKISKGRPFFSPTERQLIYNVFREWIKVPKMPSMRDIRYAIEKDIQLKQLFVKKRNIPQKVRGCIQNFYNKECKKNSKRTSV